ncbi:MAG: hypothetical protein ACK4TR_13785 [Phenylobacterium sp.]|uniref:hypothetical protein n=1 Tax=Phenylobacterium sp. TaxID=1871053 RepID=UPI003919831C
MNFARAYSLHHGGAEWERRDLSDWLMELFEVPAITIGSGCTGQIRDHLKDELTRAGWSYNVRVDQGYDLTVTGMYRDLAFQIQTGNISRAMYDLLKLQHLWNERKIEAAALAVPTKEAADKINSNLAHVDRVWGELQLFDRIITMPMLLVSFE